MQIIDKIDEKLLKSIVRFRSENFAELVYEAGLRPEVDFKYADLKGVDFTDCDLSNFDFKFADLRGAKWGGSSFIEPAYYRFALRGRGRDSVSASDHEVIFEQSLSARTWGERFFAFALAVDNFGEADIVFELLIRINDTDSSKYMRYCSYIYFIGSYFSNTDAMSYCREMASRGGARTNMFRFKRLNRYLNELTRYAETVSSDFRLLRDDAVPGLVPLEQLLQQAKQLKPNVSL